MENNKNMKYKFTLRRNLRPKDLLPNRGVEILYAINELHSQIGLNNKEKQL